MDDFEEIKKIKNDPEAKVIAMAGKRLREQAKEKSQPEATAHKFNEKQIHSDPESPRYVELNKLFEGTSYIVKNGYLMRVTGAGAEKEYRMLANFVPIPTKEVTRDDGSNSEKYFTMSGETASGLCLPDVTIQAEKFILLNWMASAWGFAANYSPGSSTRDFLRHAIFSAGKHVIIKHIYTHTGWRKINNHWAFLYNGGAVGADNVTVELEDNLSRYKLHDTATNYYEAAQASYNLLNVAPFEVMIPLLSMVYLSPLNEFFRQQGIAIIYYVSSWATAISHRL